ncbi:hypothetical protein Vadar_000724 [Vaccinium darrowii]|uniref:Uncharacterized protein n=1 Tax=Vaccinium darrowii TaxID=229202 RepID=A0ACB7YAY6_9ERIC|nr:hypothetical protein Vadar_000724 [Vaccinium darrowii]
MDSSDQTLRFSHNWLKPIVVMIVAQMIIVANNIFYKLAIIDSMPTSILVAYRFVFGVLEGAGQNQHGSKHALHLSMDYLGIINVTPIIIFVLGLIVRRNTKRLETLACRTSVGKMKLAGIMLSIGGVMLLALWKRIEINFPTKFSFLPQHYHKTKDHNDQILGLALAVIATFSYETFLTIQAKFKEDGHNIYLIPFMMNLMGAIQSVVYALCVERGWEQWKLGWNIRFWASSFVGVFSSGLTTTLTVWCISEMGPLFVSTFNPIGLILMSLVGSLLLDETLYVTSVVAIVLIIAATLLVLYGTLKEMDNDQSEDSESEENDAEVVDYSNILAEIPL